MTHGNHTDLQAATQIPALDHPILTSVEQYWQTLRHAQSIPARNTLDPNKIDSALPYAFILQRVAPGTARFRVAGQRVHDLLKMDARGMPFSTLFHKDNRDEIGDLIEKSFTEPAIIGLQLRSGGSVLKPVMHGAMILLPMQDTKGKVNRLLGAFVTPEPAPARARRFEIDRSAPLRYQTLGLKVAATRLVPRAPAQNQRPAALQQPALRLVVNNG